MKYSASRIALIVIIGCWSCTGGRDEPVAPTDVIGEDLMIALSKAKILHHKARVYASDGRVAEAISAVHDILSLEFPARAPEADDVRNDARALLAKLLVGQGQLEEAMTIVTEGIAQSQRESFFVANLYTVKGEIHEARATRLDASDPAYKAKLAVENDAAIAAYDKSNRIDTALLQRSSEPTRRASGSGTGVALVLVLLAIAGIGVTSYVVLRAASARRER